MNLCSPAFIPSPSFSLFPEPLNKCRVDRAPRIHLALEEFSMQVPPLFPEFLSFCLHQDGKISHTNETDEQKCVFLISFDYG